MSRWKVFMYAPNLSNGLPFSTASFTSLSNLSSSVISLNNLFEQCYVKLVDWLVTLGLLYIWHVFFCVSVIVSLSKLRTFPFFLPEFLRFSLKRGILKLGFCFLDLGTSHLILTNVIRRKSKFCRKDKDNKN